MSPLYFAPSFVTNRLDLMDDRGSCVSCTLTTSPHRLKKDSICDRTEDAQMMSDVRNKKKISDFLRLPRNPLLYEHALSELEEIQTNASLITDITHT